jgi:hypothetical protein
MYVGGLDFVFLIQVADPIGVNFPGLAGRVAGTHRVHPEYVIHPIASSGLPLHDLLGLIATRTETLRMRKSL